MANKNLEGPPCKWCGAALRPRRDDMTELTEAKARELKRVMNPALRPSVRTPGALYKGEDADHRWSLTYQVGWGFSNAFCRGDCAAAWAYKHVKPHKFDPRTLTG